MSTGFTAAAGGPKVLVVFVLPKGELKLFVLPDADNAAPNPVFAPQRVVAPKLVVAAGVCVTFNPTPVVCLAGVAPKPPKSPLSAAPNGVDAAAGTPKPNKSAGFGVPTKELEPEPPPELAKPPPPNAIAEAIREKISNERELWPFRVMFRRDK